MTHRASKERTCRTAAVVQGHCGRGCLGGIHDKASIALEGGTSLFATMRLSHQCRGLAMRNCLGPCWACQSRTRCRAAAAKRHGSDGRGLVHRKEICWACERSTCGLATCLSCEIGAADSSWVWQIICWARKQGTRVLAAVTYRHARGGGLGGICNLPVWTWKHSTSRQAALGGTGSKVGADFNIACRAHTERCTLSCAAFLCVHQRGRRVGQVCYKSCRARESCTSGLAAALLAEISGQPAVWVGHIICRAGECGTSGLTAVGLGHCS